MGGGNLIRKLHDSITHFVHRRDFLNVMKLCQLEILFYFTNRISSHLIIRVERKKNTKARQMSSISKTQKKQ
jgi:multisubunit Na+/H+ antiporter MnhG subunit